MENSRTTWHSLTPEEAIAKAGSRISGLTEDEAKERIVRYGANELVGKKKTPLIMVFLRQFRSPIIYVYWLPASFLWCRNLSPEKSIS